MRQTRNLTSTRPNRATGEHCRRKREDQQTPPFYRGGKGGRPFRSANCPAGKSALPDSLGGCRPAQRPKPSEREMAGASTGGARLRPERPFAPAEGEPGRLSALPFSDSPASGLFRRIRPEALPIRLLIRLPIRLFPALFRLLTRSILRALPFLDGGAFTASLWLNYTPSRSLSIPYASACRTFRTLPATTSGFSTLGSSTVSLGLTSTDSSITPSANASPTTR